MQSRGDTTPAIKITYKFTVQPVQSRGDTTPAVKIIYKFTVQPVQQRGLYFFAIPRRGGPVCPP